MSGCNGCINLNQATNSGLEKIAGPLNLAFDNYGFNATVSRADFYALSAIVAIELGQQKADQNV